MSRTHLRLLTGVLALAGVSLVAVQWLAAQEPLVLEGYAARSDALAGHPLFGGIAFTTFTGPFGLRLNGGLHLTQGDSPSYQVVSVPGCRRRECGGMYGHGGDGYAYYETSGGSGPGVGAWTADADLIFAPLRPIPALKALFLGFSPYGFVGIGGYGLRTSSGPDTNVATWSYGAGARHELLGGVGVSAEARFRQPLQNASALTTGTQRVWEYRVGLSVSFGGRHAVPTRHDVGPAVPATEPSVPTPRPGDVAEPEVSRARLASRVLDLADGYLGTPYQRGGTSPTDGFDGAGFVQYVFGKEGVRLPRTSRRMAEVGEDVSTRIGALRPGDLLFFASDGSAIDHVAIYVGRDRIIHSTASGGGVRYDVLGEGERGQWFADHLVSARRVAEDSRRTIRPRREAPPDEEDLDPPDRAPRPGEPPR
jgi:hypothetical protein